MTSSLNPDALAALEAERGFLLKSIEDLDAEHAAGDLDEIDYATLSDDYTRRAAEVLRALDEQREAFASAPKGMSALQRLATIVGVIAVASIAGVLLARSLGFRSAADSATGNIAQSTASLLAEAETLTFEREWDEAISVYDEVLENEPSNLEALTYRGWLQFQVGDGTAGESSLADAVAADPEYPDARVFRALIYRSDGRYDEAAAEIAVLDGLDTSAEIAGLVDASNLRAEVLAEQLRARFGGSSTAIDLAAIDAEPDAVIAAAQVVDEAGDAPLGIRLRDAVLAADPDNLTALIDQGRRLATTPEIAQAAPEAALRGLTLLDRAVELEPTSVQALLWRAVGRALQGDLDASRADLDALDQLAVAGALADDELDAVDQVRAMVGASE